MAHQREWWVAPRGGYGPAARARRVGRGAVKPRIVTTSVGPVVLRPMDRDYIMAADEEDAGVSVEVQCRWREEPWPNLLYVTYFQKLIEAYGSCAIMAWNGRTVVGYLPFRPVGTGMPEIPFCMHYYDDGDLAAVEAATPVPFHALETRVLRVRCLSVKPSLRRGELDLAAAQYLVEWARDHGWERIEGWALSEPACAWLPDIRLWEEAGFRRGRRRHINEDNACTQRPGFEFHMDL